MNTQMHTEIYISYMWMWVPLYIYCYTFICKLNTQLHNMDALLSVCIFVYIGSGMQYIFLYFMITSLMILHGFMQRKLTLKCHKLFKINCLTVEEIYFFKKKKRLFFHLNLHFCSWKIPSYVCRVQHEVTYQAVPCHGLLT